MKKFAMIAGAVALIVAGTVAAPGSTSAGKTKWFVDESTLSLEPLEGYEDTTEQLWGVHAGSAYLIETPADWNGDLVLYAHGFRGDGLELTVDPPPRRDARNTVITPSVGAGTLTVRADLWEQRTPTTQT